MGGAYLPDDSVKARAHQVSIRGDILKMEEPQVPGVKEAFQFC